MVLGPRAPVWRPVGGAQDVLAHVGGRWAAGAFALEARTLGDCLEGPTCSGMKPSNCVCYMNQVLMCAWTTIVSASDGCVALPMGRVCCVGPIDRVVRVEIGPL